VYSKFSNFFGKNKISKLHEDWKILPSQVRGKHFKNGSVVNPFSQNAKPILITPKKKVKKIPKLQKKSGA
jgi:hypothetical protein